MNEMIIFKMVNGKWKYVTKTRFYNNAKEICEELNKRGYNAKIIKPNGTIVRYFLVD